MTSSKTRQLLCGLGVVIFFLPIITQAKKPTADEDIVIAVVDDGFNPNHHILAGMIWSNPNELANNAVDDDGNGVVDDLIGWDVSDQDAEVSVPRSRFDDLDHGTFIAGVIATTVRQHLGELEEYPIKLMLVKAISDTSSLNTVEDGYQGIEYAIKTGADVINLSWSGGVATDEGLRATRLLAQSDVFAVGAMGNWSQPEPIFPASHASVFGVAGVDSNGVSIGGNVGVEADISALSSEFKSASTRSNSAMRIESGSSIGTARVSATVALMKLANRRATDLQIKACLKFTSRPVDEHNPNFPGLLGAGILNTKAAIDCIQANRSDTRMLSGDFEHPEGVLLYANDKPRQQIVRWRISPKGSYDGISLFPFVESKSRTADKVRVNVYANGGTSNTLWRGTAAELPVSWDFPDSDITIELSSKTRKHYRFGVRYAANTINLSERFCRGRVEVTEPMSISDGSSTHAYANFSNCEWLVLPPEGYDVMLTFASVDTQLHKDVIHLFAGEKRLQKQLLMKLSGQQTPDRLRINGGHPALLWFVSDGDIAGQGFSVNVEFVPASMAVGKADYF